MKIKQLKRFFEILVILAIAIVLIVSSIAITGNTSDGQKAERTTRTEDGKTHRWINPISKGVVWDNGMHYDGLLSAQDDPVEGLDSEPADDFMFDVDQPVSDVHWIGGYWSPPEDYDFDWRVTFYDDFGDGTKPGAVIASWVFPNSDVNETNIYLNIYSYSVDLPTPMTFLVGTKYWITIQGIGAYPPYSGWGYHLDPILLHEGVFRSVYWGYPDWTDQSLDMCFQLTYEEWPNHKMHFPQLPDLIGWDVNAKYPKTLADDWQCSETGPVIDIHFWGSWKDIDGDPATDDFYTATPNFFLSIHSNIPADVDTPWSRPGELLWWWQGEIPGTPFDPPTLEGWLDPNTGEVFPNDHVAYWRYDFVDIPDPFIQYEDSIYWLSISTPDSPSPYQWGWKNSRDHFMDDAAYTDNHPTGPWYPIVEPPRYNEFTVEFDYSGVPTFWDGTNYYGEGFYEYDYWWNMWFYDNPFTWDQPKIGWIDFQSTPNVGTPWLEFAINWSSPEWDTMGMGRPPLPGVEEMYIERQIFGSLMVDAAYSFPIDIPYNPEWISVDFKAADVAIVGNTYHECVGTSLDLAFVITGVPNNPPYEPSNPSPPDGAIDQSINVDLAWSGGDPDPGNTVTYDIYFGNTSPPPLLVSDHHDTTYDPGTLVYETQYFWRIVARDPQGAETSGPEWDFTTEADPWTDHKMHYPQLPDPEGWDIVATMGYVGQPGTIAADDFMCTESGPITGIHIWGSWMNDMEVPILGFYLSIHDNVPGPPYSSPGNELWAAYVTDFDVVPEGQGSQGWFDPLIQWWEHPNHSLYYRYDIDSIPDPFYQDSGTIYWLNVMADIGPPGYTGFPEPPLWGWKTSLEHYEDDAVFAEPTPPGYDWNPLIDPNTGLTLDLAFVITTSEVPVLCGDVNHSGAVEAGDVVFLISYLFRGGPAPSPLLQGDVNCSGAVDAGDVVYLISYLFRGGPDPCDPDDDGIPDC
jgi:hypothetical protein